MHMQVGRRGGEVVGMEMPPSGQAAGLVHGSDIPLQVQATHVARDPCADRVGPVDADAQAWGGVLALLLAFLALPLLAWSHWDEVARLGHVLLGVGVGHGMGVGMQVVPIHGPLHEGRSSVLGGTLRQHSGMGPDTRPAGPGNGAGVGVRPRDNKAVRVGPRA